jgi:hypothetical protein
MGLNHPGWPLGSFVDNVVGESEAILGYDENENDDTDDLVRIGDVFAL